MRNINVTSQHRKTSLFLKHFGQSYGLPITKYYFLIPFLLILETKRIVCQFFVKILAGAPLCQGKDNILKH